MAGQPGRDSFWTPLVVVPASEVYLVERNSDALQAFGTFTLYSAVSNGVGSVWAACGPHLLWELRHDTPVLKVGHVTFMMQAPGGAERYYKVVLGAGVTPEALGAFEAVLEEATVYEEAPPAGGGAATVAEAAAATRAQARVDADASSKRSAAPPGVYVGNPFAPDAPAAVVVGPGGGGGNPFAPAAQPEYEVVAQVLNVSPPPPTGALVSGQGGAPPPPAATWSAPQGALPPASAPPGAPPAGTWAAPQGVPPPASAPPAASHMGAPPPAAAPAAAAGAPAAAPGVPLRQESWSSKKARSIESYANKIAEGLLQRAGRSASVPIEPPPVPPGGQPDSAMKLRLAASKNLGWAAGTVSKALASGSSKLGERVAKAVENPAHAKRSEIAMASGQGLTKVFAAMEQLGRETQRSAEAQEQLVRSASAAAAADPATGPGATASTAAHASRAPEVDVASFSIPGPVYERKMESKEAARKAFHAY